MATHKGKRLQTWRPSLLLILLWLTAPAFQRVAEGQAAGKLAAHNTRAEQSNFTETSRYDDVMGFLKAVTAASPRMHLATFGYTFEGRPLPLVVVGDVADARPETVLASGKTRVYIQANIHAGEVEGKEAMQMVLRSLASGEHKGWADALVLLVAPIYNADGNERVTLMNRTRQLGPIGGMGQRPNAQGYDLNRDHMKLDSPEARSLVLLLRRYDPHVALDLHTTNGTRHAYHVTYAPPLHPNTDQGIIDLLRKEWLPALTGTIKAKYGWDYYYYGNVPGPAGPGSESPRGWYTFDHRPRFNNNYVGLRNRIAILSEAYAYLPFQKRILATRRFVEENLDYARQHAERIRKITAEADSRPLLGHSLAVRATFQASAQPVEILLGDVAEERHPYTGQMMWRRLDLRKPERMLEYGTFRATESERVPKTYYVPANLGAVIDKLEAHGIRLSRLEQPRTLTVEEFTIASAQVAERPFEQHRERTVTGSYQKVERTLPAGTIVVAADQPLGRLAFSLLEPRSDDGLLNWNVLDEALKDATVYPIMREP